MTQNNLEWLLDDEWVPTKTTHHTNKGKELDNEGYDEWNAKRMGYMGVNHSITHNYNKDMLCKIYYGINCKRNT